MVKGLRQFFRPKSLSKFGLRGLSGMLFAAIFITVTQDIQIFPGVISGFYEPKGAPSQSLPAGVSEYFAKTLDEQRIQVWYLPFVSENAAAKGVVILFHGNGDSVDSMVGIQRWISQAGYDVYSFDYRGYGRSSGWPSEEGLEFDAEAVLALVKSRHDLTKVPLIYFAISIGTGPAAYLATRYQPDVLVLVTPFSSMKEIVEEQPLFGVLSPFLWYSFPVSNYLQGLSATCIILAHGHADRTISSSHTKRLTEALAGRKVFTLYSEAARHNDIIGFLGKPVLEQVGKCLKQ